MTLMPKYPSNINLYFIKLIKDCILSCPFIIDKSIAAYGCIVELENLFRFYNLSKSNALSGSVISAA